MKATFNDRKLWIASDLSDEAAPLLRTEFELESGHGAVIRATLELSALGLVEATMNGRPTADELLIPGWTSYEWRVRVVEHDVTALLEQRSTLGLTLGNGWYRGNLGFTGARALYGDERAALASLRIEFTDGFVQWVNTDRTWRASTGATRTDDLYNGQTVDLRAHQEGWDMPGFDDSGWAGVHVVNTEAELVPRTSPAVRRLAELAAHEVITSASGTTILDFGQNLVGFVRVQAHGPAGTELTVRHAEVLDDGELGTRPLRRAQATDRYLLDGQARVLEPTLTFHGFRYAEVTGWPGDVDPAAFTAVVVGTDLHWIGDFSCSDSLLNQLHSNVVWGMRGNFLSVPTDCPQRDERLGWTGDISAFAPTATYLADVRTFLGDWLVDAEIERSHGSGRVPVVVPDALKFLDTGFPTPPATAIWGDAGVWVPWALWQAYGDLADLRDNYNLMTSHTRAVAAALSSDDVWDTGFQFGDWLDPDAPASAPGDAKADVGVVATACAFRTASTMAAAAALLGRTTDAAEFVAVRDRIRAGFHARYVDGGRVFSDCTTVYALAITFGLLHGEETIMAGDRLAELVRESGYRISTGFAGTPYICDALTTTGHIEEAYGLLLERSMPSWLYPVTMGATTIWERWDSMLPDGTINPNEMTSFNHYALGAIADWMHRTVGGLSAGEPGFRRIHIAPRPGGGLTQARSALQTPFGLASVEWTTNGATLEVIAVVPDGVTATVDIPGFDKRDLGPGRHILKSTG
ncbi:alpha-L-rhamnosidase [Subtercola frigoramans]|uniref:alpha-L-rhamnosidase n=1 Tax=Subtercola frigoramans TaxID=120298 RepID=A0ABS2L0Q7_9MICO|nr:family 78 glycoside hydrolase catalytic domain [Subtercola frigoramans]MBM7470648.1 alpha-L-rhamnosidase [Subtercola frigoramans]